MFSSVSSFGLTGIACYPVTVEADVSRAFPCFEIVGLPDAAVKESKDRVRSAMKNCGMEFPSSRVVVNLAPADTKKTGAIYDLPILVGILCSTGALPKLPEIGRDHRVPAALQKAAEQKDAARADGGRTSG